MVAAALVAQYPAHLDTSHRLAGLILNADLRSPHFIFEDLRVTSKHLNRSIREFHQTLPRPGARSCLCSSDPKQLKTKLRRCRLRQAEIHLFSELCSFSAGHQMLEESAVAPCFEFINSQTMA